MAQRGILLTGFEPFGGESVNPSWLVAQALDGESIAGLRVRSVCLPCVFGDSLEVLGAALERVRPSLVLALGLAGGRGEFTPERIAINVDDARIPDNAGRQPVDVPVVPGAPAAYFGTLPVKAIVAALHAEGWPASVSQTAGTYVCNHVFFGLMHSLRRRRGVRAGFMHLPPLPGPAAARPDAPPGLPLEAMVSAVRTALRVAATTTADLPRAGGREA